MPAIIGMGERPPMRFRKLCQCSGSKSGWVMAKCAPGLHLGEEALDFVVEVLGGGVHGHTDGVVGGAAQRLPCPVGALIQARGHFHESDGVDFIDPARLARRRRIAGNGQEVANPADAPGAEQRGLQTDEILVPRGDVRNRFHSARLQGSGQHQRVHAHAGQRAAIDVDGIHAAAGDDLVHLLEDAFERNALGRIDLHRNAKFAGLELAP